MPQEEAEFEVAKRLVGLTTAAASHAAQAQAGANPRTVARDAVAQAAYEFAPGLHRQMTQRSGRGPDRQPGLFRRPADASAAGSGQPDRGSRGTERTERAAGSRASRGSGLLGGGPGLGIGGFADVAFDEPASATGMATATVYPPPTSNGTRRMAGQWVRRAGGSSCWGSSRRGNRPPRRLAARAGGAGPADPARPRQPFALQQTMVPAAAAAASGSGHRAISDRRPPPAAAAGAGVHRLASRTRAGGIAGRDAAPVHHRPAAASMPC